MTVVNAGLVDAAAIHVPRANALFPEMAISVFELELWLIKQHGNPIYIYAAHQAARFAAAAPRP